jgi:hypothetical protein
MEFNDVIIFYKIRSTIIALKDDKEQLFTILDEFLKTSTLGSFFVRVKILSYLET